MDEVWKDIQGFEGLYQVSTWGRIRSKRGFLKPYSNHKGYLKVCLSKDGVKYKKRVNRLVAEAFIDNPLNLPQVNHKDRDKSNNAISNLEWVTAKENRDHFRRMRKSEREQCG